MLRMRPTPFALLASELVHWSFRLECQQLYFQGVKGYGPQGKDHTTQDLKFKPCPLEVNGTFMHPSFLHEPPNIQPL